MRLFLTTIFSFALLHANNGILDIKWPTPNTKHLKPTLPYPSVLTEGINKTKLPVYIPSPYAHDKTMIVVADKNFYTISFILKGATIIMSGDKTFQESVKSTNLEFKALMKATPAVEFIHAEGIMTAEFNRHGANYALSIECDKPKKDSRCKEEGLIRELYNRLIIVGGQA